MIDRKPASEYMEEARKAIGKLDDFNERNHISGKAFSSMIIIFLIIILCFVYLWQLRHPKEEAPAPTVYEQTQEEAPVEEAAPAEEVPAEVSEETAGEEASSAEETSSEESGEASEEENSGEEEASGEEASE